MAQDTEKMRDEFERRERTTRAFALRGDAILKRNAGGYYLDNWTQAKWEGYQAGITHPQIEQLQARVNELEGQVSALKEEKRQATAIVRSQCGSKGSASVLRWALKEQFALVADLRARLSKYENAEPVAWEVNGKLTVLDGFVELVDSNDAYVMKGRAIPASWKPVIFARPKE